MQWFLIVVGVVLALVAWAFFIWHSVTRSIELSKPLIEKAVVYEQQTSSSSKRILVAGDSTGVGVGASDNKASIAGRIGSQFPDWNIVNISVSGARLSDLEKKLNDQTGGFTLVLLQIGANDITGNTSYEEIRSTLSRVLARTDTLSTRVVVITAGNVGLSPAFKWPLSLYVEHRTREVRKIFMEEIAKHPNASYIDLFKEREDEPFNKDIPRYYAPDLFHPSGEGYGVWFEKLKSTL